MFIEKRKSGGNIKFYLVHSFRDYAGTVKKIRKYLGQNLDKNELSKKEKTAKKLIQKKIELEQKKLFSFTLIKKQLDQLNKFDIKVKHLDLKDWQRFTETFVFNTNAIEGSTVLAKEVPKILSKKKVIEPEEIETKGVAKAIEYIRKTKDNLSLKLILKLHQLCFEGSKSFAGKFRDVEVAIRGRDGEIIHTGAPVKDLIKELEAFITGYNENKDEFKPLVLAAIIHNQFEHIHPFQDGNGRVGRLLLNYILIKNNYPPINILLKDRGEYYFTLQEYSSKGNLIPTLEFLVKQYNQGDH